VDLRNERATPPRRGAGKPLLELVDVPAAARRLQRLADLDRPRSHSAAFLDVAMIDVRVR
jgi:hypothetical protein